MRSQSFSYKHSGFTLIELMVVIVIIGILASLVLMNVGGVDQRKAMQAREHLILDLKQIARQAIDQNRIYAMVIEPATDVSSFRYSVKEYRTSPQQNNQTQFFNQSHNNTQKKWVNLDEFPSKALPNSVSFTIELQDHQFENAQNSDLVGENAPRLIWFGNGEVKPVNIQIYYDQKPVGDLIQIDYLGKVIDQN